MFVFADHKLFNIDKDKIDYENFVKDLKLRKERGFSFHVGADSQMHFDYILFVTTICYHHRTKGAAAYYYKMRVPRKEHATLRARMSKELFLALEAAINLQSLINIPPSKLTVHLDIGSNPLKNKTHVFHKEFTSIVKSQGYMVETKPHSWASSEVADWFTK